MSFYVGLIFNLKSKEQYTGNTTTDGITVSLGEVGITAGITRGWGQDAPGGFFIGYAPGAQFSYFHSEAITQLWIP